MNPKVVAMKIEETKQARRDLLLTIRKAKKQQKALEDKAKKEKKTQEVQQEEVE